MAPVVTNDADSLVDASYDLLHSEDSEEKSVEVVSEEDSSMTFDYDSCKQDNVLDRVLDVTTDRVSFRETYALLEMEAVKKFHPPQLIQIDGLPDIWESPNLNRRNYK